jgi:Ca2+-binding EF-hand superfamily protein
MQESDAVPLLDWGLFMSMLSGLQHLVFALAAVAAAQPDMPRPTTSFDPNVIFESWDRNKDGVVTREELSDRRSLSRFEDYLRRANVTDGKLTRETFLKAFQERMAELTRNSAGEAERILRSLDRNGDGKLDADELQRTQRLKNEVAKWDANKDGVLDAAELKSVLEAYNRERLTGVVPAPSAASPTAPAPGVAPAEAKPAPVDPNIVYRPGKLPSTLPDWFSKLDVDNDAQIALHEWKGQKLELFLLIDRNGDGILTVTEVLRWQAAGGK